MDSLVIDKRHSHEFINIDGSGYFGFELELDSAINTKINRIDKTKQYLIIYTEQPIKYKTFDNFHLEHDGSLISGFELVSDIHSDETFDRIDWMPIEQISRELGYDDSGKAGFHLHVAKDIFINYNTAIDKLYTAIELNKDIYKKILNIPPNDRWFKDHEIYFDKHEKHFNITVDEYRKFSILYLPDKHCSDTIEFRGFKIGTDFDMAKHIVKLLTGICKNIENCSFEDLSDLSKLCELVPIETKEYYKKYLNI